jgi:glycosyltransferase involved in cell wall biosynthesis
VLTATFNGERFLAEAVESVLTQSFADFEYVIVDDASIGAAPALLAAFAAREPRVRLVCNAANLGPAGALNAGLAQARGDYLAILDHDDLALPERLARQVAFLDATPRAVAVGAQVRGVDEQGALAPGVAMRRGADTDTLRWRLVFGASLLHSASMYRLAAVRQAGGYSTGHPSLCDYDLLVRLAEFGELANLDETLCGYRRSAGQYSALNRLRQQGQMLLLQYALLQRWLGLRVDLQVWRVLRAWLYGAPPPDEHAARAAMACLETVVARYLERQAPARPEAVTRDAAGRWLRLAHHAYRVWPAASRDCWREALRLDPDLPKRPETREIVRRRRPQA